MSQALFPFRVHLRSSILLLASCALLFSSCGFIPLGSKTTFEPETEGVTVMISEKEEGPYREVENNKIKLNHYKQRYWLRQSKPGFLDWSGELNRNSANHWRRSDILTAISNTIATTVLVVPKIAQAIGTLEPYPFSEIGMYSMIGITVVDWAAVGAAPARLFPRKHSLPELTPIMKREEGEHYLIANNFDIELKKNRVRVHDYPSISRANRGYGYDSRDSTPRFDFLKDLDLEPAVSSKLEDLEFSIDSSSATDTSTLRLNSHVTGILYTVAEKKMKCDVKTAWGLETNDELMHIYGFRMHQESRWFEFDEEDLSESAAESAIKDAFEDALGKSLVKFIGIDTIQSILNQPPPIPLLDEKEMSISSGNLFAADLSEAVNSVVTVVNDKGHGSGCIITEDGYIITNAHVVEDDTSSIRAIFTDDVENEIPLEFVRMNEAIDLALLKVDSAGFKPLKIGSNADVKTGAEVYAIGTPADLELGQSVTKGIISGKRKFGGHSVIQTDVAISPGNSGGALITKEGVLIGVVTAELKSRRIDDIGFAIPVDVIEDALKLRIE